MEEGLNFASFQKKKKMFLMKNYPIEIPFVYTAATASACAEQIQTMKITIGPR